MSQKELDQVAIFEVLKDKTMKQSKAAVILNLSTRQVKRKLKKYRLSGAAGLVHGSRGKPSNHRLDEGLIAQALDIVKQHYADFTPTFASEKLRENHHLVINSETLRLKMIKAGLWQPWQRRIKHRGWRERRACLGELVILDGSDHSWFEDRAPRCTALAFIDDATSKLLRLELVKQEANIPVMQATKSYLNEYGRPLTFYMDKGKVFRVNIHNPDEDKLTQYRRCLEELNIQTIYAHSPQAKGRVERVFNTLQDRLVKELRLRNINTIKEANRYIENDYLGRHNQKFAVAPREPSDLHRKLVGFNLDEIFTIKEPRMLTNDFTLRYRNHWLQLERQQKTLVFPGNGITVVTNLKGEISLKLRRTILTYHEIPKPTVRQIAPVLKPVRKPTKPWVPAVDHPWRKYTINHQPKVTFLNC